MFNEKMYELAYYKLKSNPGNMTPGINDQTLDGVSLEVFREIILRMKDESFKFEPGRLVNIPKPSGGTRPLVVRNPRDKIVQEVMRMIIEAIYEPTFSDNSHGFRTDRSCHTALRQIRCNFGSASFMIEGDISKCFPSIDHKILMTIIERRISDQRFLRLITKSLNAGHLAFHEVQRSITGTPQGSIVSPILSNIFLHELDEFMDNLKREFDKGKEAKRNPEYRRLEFQRSKAVKNMEFAKAATILKQMQKVKARLPNDPNFRRLNYVRYADDWLVAIRGSLSETKTILAKISSYLKDELKLTVSETKTLITDPRKVPALFLGTQIKISSHTGMTAGKHGQRIRTVSQIVMMAPLDRIHRKLAEANFLSLEDMKSKPRFL